MFYNQIFILKQKLERIIKDDDFPQHFSNVFSIICGSIGSNWSILCAFKGVFLGWGLVYFWVHI
ncbi:MAG: hypothetical protein QM539_04490 [Alphaproteobacteria bacterium]|nr:hypothetical protein [Alphaproteobacteria bacterium]